MTYRRYTTHFLVVHPFCGRVVRSAPVPNQSKLTRLFRTKLDILNIQSEQQQWGDEYLRLTDMRIWSSCKWIIWVYRTKTQQAFRLHWKWNIRKDFWKGVPLLKVIRPVLDKVSHFSRHIHPLGTYFSYKMINVLCCYYFYFLDD